MLFYTATAEYIIDMEHRPVKHSVSVSGVLTRLGVSRSGYHAWKKNSDFSTELHNILNEQFNPDQPYAVLVLDITYIWIFDSFVYLTSIMDLYSRKIIGVKRNTGSTACSGMYRESKGNPQDHTPAHHTYG